MGALSEIVGGVLTGLKEFIKAPVNIARGMSQAYGGGVPEKTDKPPAEVSPSGGIEGTGEAARKGIFGEIARQGAGGKGQTTLDLTKKPTALDNLMKNLDLTHLGPYGQDYYTYQKGADKPQAPGKRVEAAPLSPSGPSGGIKPKAEPFTSSLNARVRDIGGGNETRYRYASPTEMAAHPDKGGKIEPFINLGKGLKGLRPNATKEMFPDKGAAGAEGGAGGGNVKVGGVSMPDYISQRLKAIEKPRQMMSPGGSPYDTGHSDATERTGLLTAGIEGFKAKSLDEFHKGVIANQKENIEVIKSEQNVTNKAKMINSLMAPYAVSDPADPTRKQMNIPLALSLYDAHPEMFKGTPLQGIVETAKTSKASYVDAMKQKYPAKFKKNPAAFMRETTKMWSDKYAPQYGAGVDTGLE